MVGKQADKISTASSINDQSPMAVESVALSALTGEQIITENKM